MSFIPSFIYLQQPLFWSTYIHAFIHTQGKFSIVNPPSSSLSELKLGENPQRHKENMQKSTQTVTGVQNRTVDPGTVKCNLPTVPGYHPYFMLCYVMSRYVKLHYVTLHYIILCYVICEYVNVMDFNICFIQACKKNTKGWMKLRFLTDMSHRPYKARAE